MARNCFSEPSNLGTIRENQSSSGEDPMPKKDIGGVTPDEVSIAWLVEHLRMLDSLRMLSLGRFLPGMRSFQQFRCGCLGIVTLMRFSTYLPAYPTKMEPTQTSCDWAAFSICDLFQRGVT